MFPLMFSNVPISQFHAKLSNLRVKIKRVVLNIDVHERIRKKGIRTLFFSHYNASPSLSDRYLPTTTLMYHLMI